ncbi:two-component system response regulator HydG [Clostridiales Family XIII bacterium PM5-7]
MDKSTKNYNVLIVDDEVEYQNVVSIILEDAGYQTEACSNGEEALAFLEKNAVDLLITDLRMPVMSGLDLIKNVIEAEYDLEILVITAFGSIEGAVEAIKLGATDYFVKSTNLDELLIKVGRMAKIKRLEQKSNILIKNQNIEDVFLDSKSKQYLQLIDMCNRTADTNINILLLGESGVGKEVIANYIHRISNRANEPFVPVNCQVFPEGVIESELFGHEKGAFTGAMQARIGKFEEANYGTLFLDEVGDLPITTQGKLLRVLESKCIERIGSNKLIDLDVRFISATNKSIEQEISNGQFRDDLLFRINTLTLTIPPLRERREDLPSLIDFFIRKIEIDQKKKITKIDDDVMEHLLNYNYPGNIRELKNLIERMVALSKDGEITMAEVLMPNEFCLLPPFGDTDLTLREARGQFEQVFITRVLENAGWNVSKCAEKLDITTRQLWNKINQYHIKIERKV